ncbi:MAG: MoxR family ATPase [Scytonema sp. PMC 1069.18]|nr:MoxR family ATPase [Scytonema sp. PMC 1069.18]MEC4887834.1 MoxR family ATPase [Scytonema sp. PMC 1070.18]
MTSWKIFKGTPDQPHNGIERLPAPPNWRNFAQKKRGITYQIRGEEIELVNAALYLRRPLLVTGKPGTGKTSLAYAVSEELQLGEVLRWNITTRSTLQEGLYDYDAIGRLQEASEKEKDNLTKIGKYIQLGPLGTALLPSAKPRVLLIDEIDKSDIDLPNDLLNIFEEGEFEIRELTRIADAENAEEESERIADAENAEEESEKFSNMTVRTYDNQKTTIINGQVQCQAFPFVVLTSNGEREFPPAFLRRCLRLDLPEPTPEALAAIVKAHLGDSIIEKAKPIIERFLKRREEGDLATDQLLNAIYLLTRSTDKLDNAIHPPVGKEKERLIEQLLRYLSSREGL